MVVKAALVVEMVVEMEAGMEVAEGTVMMEVAA